MQIAKEKFRAILICAHVRAKMSETLIKRDASGKKGIVIMLQTPFWADCS